MKSDEWAEVIRGARDRPALYVGSEERGHLFAIAEPLRVAWESGVLTDLRAAEVVVSPTQYHLRVRSGPLVGDIERRGAWRDCAVLTEELIRVGRELMGETYDESAPWFQRFTYTHLGSPAFPLILAERGLIGIRTAEGLWCQTYEQGWPRTPPFLAEGGHSVGLVVAAALSPRHFNGLPYVLEDLEAALPDAVHPHVRIEWRPVDNLVTEETLEPASILRWL